MESLKQRAEYYRRAVLWRLLPVAEVIGWCDSVIEAEAAPDVAIIQASMAGRRGNDAVAKALEEVEGAFDERLAFQQIFGLMFEQLEEDRGRASVIARTLSLMAMDDEVPDENAGEAMGSFSDSIDWEIEMEFNGYDSKLQALTDELLAFLDEQRGSGVVRPAPSPKGWRRYVWFR